MNPFKAGYWLVTGLVAVPVMMSGAANVAHVPDVVESMKHLGFDLNFMTILGLWKILGGLTILVRPNEALTEWAYAGLFFTLSGAAWAHVAAGDGLGGALAPLVMLAFAMLSRGMAFVRNN
jgi:hypothetical protein